MNRLEFFNKLNKYYLEHGITYTSRGTHTSGSSTHTNDHTKTHSSGGTSFGNANSEVKKKNLSPDGREYIYKIPNYYPDGRARYFYHKEELDAYRRSEEAKKVTPNSIQQKMDETAKRKELSNYQNLSPEQKKNEEYRKNAEAAANAEAQKAAQMKANANTKKSSSWQEEAERLRKKEQTRKEEEEKKAKQEAMKSPELKQLEAHEAELTKLKGKQNLAKNKGLDKEENRKEYNRLRDLIEAKEKEIAEDRKAIAKKNDSGRDAAIKKAYDKEQVRKTAQAMKEEYEENERQKAAVKDYKKKSKEEIQNQFDDIYNEVRKLYTERTDNFNVNNEMFKLIDAYLKQNDKKYDGDMVSYIAPDKVGPITVVDKEKHVENVKKAIEDIYKELSKEIDNATYEDTKHGTFINKKIADSRHKKAAKSDADKARSIANSRANWEENNKQGVVNGSSNFIEKLWKKLTY